MISQSRKILVTMSKPDNAEFVSLSKIIVAMIFAAGLIGIILNMIVTIV